MTALLELEPREAGAEELEPVVDFAVGNDGLHQRFRCLFSVICHQNSDICVPTQ